MDPLVFWISIPSVFIITVLFCRSLWFNRISLLEEKVKTSGEKEANQLSEISQLRSQIDSYVQTIHHLEKDNLILDSDFKNLQERFVSMSSDREVQLQKFEALANKILNQQTENIEHKQRIGLKNVLDPLQEKIRFFEEKLEKSTLENVSRGEGLKEQINLLLQRTAQVSQDANNLAKALKGDFKSQGNWGEIILQSILEKSGLEKDREYFIQKSEREEQKLYRPDVMLLLPDSKKIIIDSKVSLNAYNQFVNAVSEEDQKIALIAHTLAVKNHIQELTSKNYQNLYITDSPDFVLMFIPIDSAFVAALQGHHDLYNYAFDQNIIVVTPSTLLATLKTVESLWRNDKMNRNAIEIAHEAGKMYDKFASLADDLNKVERQMETAHSSVQESIRKLGSGKGNLLSRATKIRELGAKYTRSISLTEETEL